jgi:hypothetical protein
MWRGLKIWDSILFAMKKAVHHTIAPVRTFGAWVCLFALVTLWAPMWAAVSNANAETCCEGGMCAAHKHSKTNQPAPRDAAATNCDHHSGIMNCSLSCGRDSSPSVTTALIFVLPGSTAICEPARVFAAPTGFAPTAFVVSYDPLSPPPRSSHFSL